ATNRRDQQTTQAKTSRGQWTGDGGSWASSTLSQMLESWAAWLADTPFHTQLEPVTRQSVARQLAAAQIYE
ncbi:hypothetical protein, partial [Streptomyces sp. NPDC003032]